MIDKKFLINIFSLLSLSVVANYLLAYVFPVLNGTEFTFLAALACSAALVLVPLSTALIISSLYKLIKKRGYNHYWPTAWVVWFAIYIIPFLSFHVYEPALYSKSINAAPAGLNLHSAVPPLRSDPLLRR